MTSIRPLLLLLVLASCSRDRRDTSADSLATLPPADTVQTPRDTAGPVDSVPRPGPVTVEQAVINGILWGAPEADVKQRLGAPDSSRTGWDAAMGDSSTVLHYAGLRVSTVDGQVVAIRCTAQTCITADAVRVGATLSELEQVYGPAEGKPGAGGEVTYPFTTDGSCALRFELGQGRVREIEVSCLKPK